MDKPKLMRRRFIPDELVHLKDDMILYMNEDIIVTKWKVLKPRFDFTNGMSCYFFKEGYKVSKLFDDNGKCLYIYCDIIETHFNGLENTYTFNDLLLDVIIYEDGFVKVMDVGEVTHALDSGLISVGQAKYALSSLDKLLNIIYDGKLGNLTRYLDGI